MSALDDAKLRRLDLTLLLVFEETMTSGKLSSAARRLGLTQSAISHAVGRLRDVFGDALFVRTPRGVQPTPRARELRPAVAEALRLLQGAVRPMAFDPAATNRVFRIAAPDYETALFAPSLATALGPEHGPRYVFLTMDRASAITRVAAAEIDLLLGYLPARADGCQAETLFDETYLVVGRQPARATMGLADYLAQGHVLVAPNGSLDGIVDHVLARMGRSRRVVLAVPYFFAALATVAATALIATVPRRIALAKAPHFGLTTFEPPVEIRHFPVRMAWGARMAGDPSVAWLRRQVAEAARAMAD